MTKLSYIWGSTVSVALSGLLLFSAGGGVATAFGQASSRYMTSDGSIFATEAEAQQHAAVTYERREATDTTYKTSDGKSFQDRAEADAHAASTVPTVSAASRDVTYWGAGGRSFDTEAAADAYAASCALSVSERYKVVYHDAVTHIEYTLTWAVDRGGKYYKTFDTEAEAVAYWEQLGREHPGEEIGGYCLGNQKAHTVVDREAYDEQVPYWATSDGAAFDSEAESHARSTVSAVSRKVTCWATSDGRSFDDEAAAHAYAASCALTVSEVTGTHSVYDTSDGQEFANEASALAYCKEIAKDGYWSFTSEPMYRLYNPYSGEHFYTASLSERDNVVAAGWKYEGIGWIAPSASKTPVYRLYSGSDHHYTTSSEERDSLVASGWSYEGISWYSCPGAQAVPLYRQFNPNVDSSASAGSSGSHNYTLSMDENNALVSAGWQAEDVAWYGLNE